MCNFWQFDLQVGGTDQLGNITTGYQLIGRLVDKKVYGLTTPILADEKGNKYGKSSGSAVWLNRNKMSPFQFYQSFLRVHDNDVNRFLKLFTFLPDGEIEQIMHKFLKKTSGRYAQERLAESVTLLVHGDEGLEMAKKTTAALYANDLQSIARMTVDEMRELFAESALMCNLYLDPGETTVLDLAIRAKCFPNESEAGHAIRAGGFSINYKQVLYPDKLINEEEHILPNGLSLLKVGKKRYYLVKWR